MHEWTHMNATEVFKNAQLIQYILQDPNDDCIPKDY